MRVFANSILARNAKEAIERINASDKFEKADKVTAARIISMLFSSKSRMHLSDEEAESRVDYISDYLGIPKGIVIRIVNLLREESILADTKDMTCLLYTSRRRGPS